jgi:hypothetical protein
MKPAALFAFAALAAPATPSRADINFISGTQTNHGFVRVFGATPLSLTYDHAAPDPLASWYDPESIALLSADGMSRASVTTLYSSTILPQHVACDLQLQGISTSRNGNSSANILQVFSLSFAVDAPMPVDIFASMSNNGPFPGDPISLVFGRDGDAPIMNFSIEFGSQSFPLTSMVLQPGNYTVAATHQAHLSSGAIGVFWSSHITFDMVPSPAAFAPALLTLTFVRRRRA